MTKIKVLDLDEFYKFYVTSLAKIILSFKMLFEVVIFETQILKYSQEKMTKILDVRKQ
jgi:hypothetical protein